MNASSMRLSRREVLRRIGGGFGALGLASIFAEVGRLPVGAATVEGSATGANNPLAPKLPHFPARAKRVIFLFMNGAPSHVDTFDPKPALKEYEGQMPTEKLQRNPKAGYMPSPFEFAPRGESGVIMSELFPHLAQCADDLCVI